MERLASGISDLGRKRNARVQSGQEQMPERVDMLVYFKDTEEFTSTPPLGTVTEFVISLLFEVRRVLVRFRLPLQRTKFPARRRAAPIVAKRNGSEKMPTKFRART
jgi:hypothetical protein